MKYITFAFSYILNVSYGFKPFNKVVVGSDVSSKLSSIVFAKKGYNVCNVIQRKTCLLYTSPSPRDGLLSRMPSSA